MKRKLISLVTAATMAATIFALPVFGQEAQPIEEQKTAAVQKTQAAAQEASAQDVKTLTSSSAGNLAYAVTGGNLYFNKATKTIVGCDENVTKATIPASIKGVAVKTIAENAFSECKKLKSVTIPKSVTKIEIDPYDGCFTSNYFEGTAKLQSIHVDKNNKYYASKDGVLFNKKKTVLIKYPEGKTNKKYTVPNGVKRIKVTAFLNCKKLVQLHIPKSVTNIEMGETDSWMRWGFDYCEKLKKFTVSSANKTYSAKDGVLFNKKKTVLIKYPEGKTNKKYTVPKGVKTVKTLAFIRSGDKNRERHLDIYLPETVTTIENRMPYSYYQDISMSVPKSVKKIISNEDTYSWIWGNTYYTKGSYIEKFLKNYAYCDTDFTIRASKLSGKADLKATAPGNKKVKLTYTAVKDATGYQIYVKKPGAKKFVKAKTTASKKVTLSKLKKGKAYQYKVRAYRTVGNSKIYSPFSAVQKVKVK